MSNTGPLLWNESSKIQVFTIIYVFLSVRGCGGQNMLIFRKLVDETQMPQSQDYTDTFIIIYKLFLVGL
jgi:hypothetical protein